MELGLRLVVIAMVALIASSIVVFLFTGQARGFESFLGGQTDSAKCKMYDGPEDVPDSSSFNYKEVCTDKEETNRGSQGGTGNTGSGGTCVDKGADEIPPEACGDRSYNPSACNSCSQGEVCCK